MKNRGQRSVYFQEEDWERAKEMAWQRRMSVSALLVRLMDREAERKPRKRKSEKGPTAPGQEGG